MFLDQLKLAKAAVFSHLYTKEEFIMNVQMRIQLMVKNGAPLTGAIIKKHTKALVHQVSFMFSTFDDSCN